MTYHVDHNIAIAMDTPRGLLRAQREARPGEVAARDRRRPQRGSRRDAARAARAPRARRRARRARTTRSAPPRDASPDRARASSLAQVLGAEGKLGRGAPERRHLSLSNIGNIGGTYMSPVINAPQVAIGAMGKIQKLPRFDAAGNVVRARACRSRGRPTTACSTARRSRASPTSGRATWRRRPPCSRCSGSPRRRETGASAAGALPAHATLLLRRAVGAARFFSRERASYRAALELRRPGDLEERERERGDGAPGIETTLTRCGRVLPPNNPRKITSSDFCTRVQK